MQTHLKTVRTLEELYKNLETVQIALSSFKEQEKFIKDEILTNFEVKLGLAYVSKSEPFGVVNFEEDGFKVTFNTPKKVDWDQEGLEKLLNDGAPVKVKYDVSETVYKELNDAGKAEFDKYRTVEPGTITVKIERVK